MNNSNYLESKFKFIHDQIQQGIDVKLVCADIGVNLNDYLHWSDLNRLAELEKETTILRQKINESESKTDESLIKEESTKEAKPSAHNFSEEEKKFLDQMVAIMVEIMLQKMKESTPEDLDDKFKNMK